MTTKIRSCITSVLAMAMACGMSLAADDAKTGTIAGKAIFKGEAPPRKKIDTAADPNCCKDHPEPMTEDVVVDKENGLKNVVIYVKEGLEEGKEHKAPADPVIVDQVGCVFVPHVACLMVGQKLKVTNSDNTLHNVHGLPRKGSEFNDVQNKKGSFTEYSFKEPEMPGFIIKCDVHSWMKSYVWVFPHPYFAVSKEDGTFSLPPLPPGEYSVEVWHEKCGKQQHKVKVEEGKKAELNLTLELRKRT